MPETRTTSQKMLEYDAKEGWRYKKITKTQRFDSFDGMFRVEKTETSFEPLESEGILKSVQFDVIFTKIALNPKTMENIYSYWLQKMEASVPRTKEYRHIFVSICNGLLFKHDLANGRTMHVAVNAPDSDVTVERIGKGKRLSLAEAQKLLSEKKVYQHVLSQNSEGQFDFRTVLR
jgi:hypothetical protein